MRVPKRLLEALPFPLTPPGEASLNATINRLSRRLGLGNALEVEALTPGVAARKRPRADEARVLPTESVARAVFYSPDLDGAAEPGEVVWVSVTGHENSEVIPLVVVGHEGSSILGLAVHLSVTPPDEDEEDLWQSIGAGVWDPSGVPGWVRLDKVVLTRESTITRKGARVPRTRFDQIAHRLRVDYNWN